MNKVILAQPMSERLPAPLPLSLSRTSAKTRREQPTLFRIEADLTRVVARDFCEGYARGYDARLTGVSIVAAPNNPPGTDRRSAPLAGRRESPRRREIGRAACRRRRTPLQCLSGRRPARPRCRP